MASRLATGLRHWRELVHFDAVTGHALNASQRARVRFEMDSVPRRRSHSLPHFPFSGYVAPGTDVIGNLGMRGNLLRALGHPDHQLPHAGRDRLLMTIMTL